MHVVDPLASTRWLEAQGSQLASEFDALDRVGFAVARMTSAEPEGALYDAKLWVTHHDLEKHLEATRPEATEVQRPLVHEEEPRHWIAHGGERAREQAARDGAAQRGDELAQPSAEAGVGSRRLIPRCDDEVDFSKGGGVEQVGDHFGRMLEVAVHDTDP